MSTVLEVQTGPPPTPAAARRGARYASLDLWRGVACLSVLLHHSTFVYPATALYASSATLVRLWSELATRLWIGVPVFFVISGYCIAATADSQRRRGRPAADYFVRRFRRIFPPYWAVLLLTVVGFTLTDVLLWPGSLSTTGEFLRPWWYSASQWFGNITLTEIWRTHAFGSSKALMLGHAWTLCYEEQFYLVVGALLVLAPRHLFLGLSGVTAAVVALPLALPGVHQATNGFFWDGAWLLFFLGVIVYYALVHGSRRLQLGALLVFAVAIIWSVSAPDALLEAAKNRQQEMLVAALTAAALLCLRPFDERIFGTAALAPLARCGLMCYSLYLVHLPIAVMARGLLTAANAPAWMWHPVTTVPVLGAISLAAAWQFHIHVERRFMNQASTSPVTIHTAGVKGRQPQELAAAGP